MTHPAPPTHERLLRELEAQLDRARHENPPDLAEIGRLLVAVEGMRRGWLREHRNTGEDHG